MEAMLLTKTLECIKAHIVAYEMVRHVHAWYRLAAYVPKFALV